MQLLVHNCLRLMIYFQHLHTAITAWMNGTKAYCQSHHASHAFGYNKAMVSKSVTEIPIKTIFLKRDNVTRQNY